jgi:flagellin-like hook-associated protein FlgL
VSVSSVSSGAALSIQAIMDMRSRLDDLQRQLGTGKKSDTYAGIGLDRGLTVGLRSQLSAVSGFQGTTTSVGVRLDLMQTALQNFTTLTQDSKASILNSQFVLHGDTQTQEQKRAVNQLDEALNLLSTRTDERYLFSGRTVDQPPVESGDVIINGDGVRAGLKQVIAERLAADLGASGLGRLTVGGAGAVVSLAEDAVSPFGFKLVGANSALTGSSVSGPSGSPPSLSVSLGANPADGETVRFSFTLPDGSSEDITLTATTSATPGSGQFTIGATATDTATNLRAALTGALGTLANTALTAASAVAAGEDFFAIDDSDPPQRVAGPPFDSATALVGGTDADTVIWYVGDAGTDDPRSTALARADRSLTLSYGARANEHALRMTVQSVAVFAAMTFSDADPDAGARYAALKQRLGAALVGKPNEQKISDIQGELAGAQVALADAKDRHQQATSTLQTLLQDVEGVTPEEVAAQILALQTSLQATLQTTSLLLQTTLLKYI